MEILKIIGKRIAQARIENKLSQEKLAELSGLHKNYIGSIERAEKNPTIIVLHKISKALGTSLAEILKNI